ncbi:MAG: LysM peptidoglycan-binding domain-containing protein, partial [Bacteroidaceae bacterium]|nr:LysM peptidoglycan-binding domain-containing protein [Bacteroidaceae bacterium]
VYHTIRQGDNLWTLAKRNHTTVNKLLELNGINEKSPLQIGKKLRIK